ncbi:MAG: hypothetical protein K9L86_07820 [Candidatus Omnitrophica bacterium]|nr:hypothetical protein [Candidatus Omnitrophota bacterium]
MSLNKWDYFWSEYMVWTLRLICYFSDYHFYAYTKNRFFSNNLFIFDVIIWIYSIFCLSIIEKTVNKKYNPKYENLKLTNEELAYRVGRERILFSCFIFCGINFLLGMAISLISSGVVDQSIFWGVFSLIGSIVAVFLGIIFLVARDVKTNKKMPILYPFGIFVFSLPTVYIIIMMWSVFFLR